MPDPMQDRITLRLPPDTMEELRLVALFRDSTISEIVRAAVVRELRQRQRGESTREVVAR